MHRHRHRHWFSRFSAAAGMVARAPAMRAAVLHLVALHAALVCGTCCRRAAEAAEGAVRLAGGGVLAKLASSATFSVLLLCCGAGVAEALARVTGGVVDALHCQMYGALTVPIAFLGAVGDGGEYFGALVALLAMAGAHGAAAAAMLARDLAAVRVGDVLELRGRPGRFVVVDDGRSGGPWRVYVQQVSSKLVDITVEHYELISVTSVLGINTITVS